MRQFGKNRRMQVGFSLLEILVALLILSVVLLGFLSAQSSAIYHSTQAQQKVSALDLLAAQAQATRYFNIEQKQRYSESLQALLSNLDSKRTPMIRYKAQVYAQQVRCFSEGCSALSLAEAQATLAARHAADNRVILQSEICAEGALCLKVAWGNQPLEALKRCAVSPSCVYLEAY